MTFEDLGNLGNLELIGHSDKWLHVTLRCPLAGQFCVLYTIVSILVTLYAFLSFNKTTSQYSNVILTVAV